MTFRSFIAVEIGEFSELARFSDELRRTDTPLKMVNLKNLHITLKFLGDIEESQVSGIEEVIRSAVSGIGPFTMKVEDTGAFPNLGRISVVWAGISGADPLGEIAGKIDAGLHDLGFKKEKRGFSPHVTIARVRGGRNKERLVAVIHKFEKVEFGQTAVDKIILKKSVLTPQGPIYSDVLAVDL